MEVQKRIRSSLQRQYQIDGPRKINAQEDNIRLVAMERQCGGTMKLLENYSNLDLTGNLNLELLEPGTLCKVIRVIQIWITLRSWRS